MNIPTDKEFEEADRLDAARNRHLNAICENVLRRFKPVCRLHDVWMFPQGAVGFRTYIFFKLLADTTEYKANGVVDAIMSFVYDELERYGRGKRPEMTVAFELDSDERVQKDFGGDYWARVH